MADSGSLLTGPHASRFFFLMIRRPPRSLLFPYPPLSRSTPSEGQRARAAPPRGCRPPPPLSWIDRKSTRLNSSHVRISYAVFCLKKNDKVSARNLREGRALRDSVFSAVSARSRL